MEIKYDSESGTIVMSMQQTVTRKVRLQDIENDVSAARARLNSALKEYNDIVKLLNKIVDSIDVKVTTPPSLLYLCDQGCYANEDSN